MMASGTTRPWHPDTSVPAYEPIALQSILQAQSRNMDSSQSAANATSIRRIRVSDSIVAPNMSSHEFCNMG
jgi:hypothetical protein